MEWIIINLSVFFTSILSGIFGMGGGTILMGVYGSLLPVVAALVLHGMTQIAANGFRCLIHFKHIRWRIVCFYLPGALLAFLLFRLIAYIPEKSYFLIALGLFPFLGLVIPRVKSLDITRPSIAALCGLLATSSQILVGVSGAVLDVFYLRSSMNRFELVGTKAVTQTFGHFLKLVYYYNLYLQIEGDFILPIWIFPSVVVVASLGTIMGKQGLKLLRESQFRRISETLMLGIGCILFTRGVLLLDF